MKHLLSLTILCVLLSSCNRPPDVPVCRPLDAKITEKRDAFGIIVREIRANPVCDKEIKEPSCGRCVWTISDKVQYVGEAKERWIYGKPWSRIRVEALVTPTESWAKIKANIVKSCKETNCDEQIPRWRVKLDSLDSIDDVFKKP